MNYFKTATLLLFILIYSNTNAQNLNKNLHAFRSESDLATNSEATLSILADIADAKIVGLPENGHRIKEAFKLRTELIKSLILSKNFRVITFEADWYLVEMMNNLISSEKNPNCNPVTESTYYLLSFNSGIEFTDNLIPWICKFNKNNPNDKVILTGSDFQRSTGADPRIYNTEDIVPLIVDLKSSPLNIFNTIVFKYLGDQKGLEGYCIDMINYIPRENWYMAMPNSIQKINNCYSQFVALKKNLNQFSLSVDEQRAVLTLDASIYNTLLRVMNSTDGGPDENQRDLKMAEITIFNYYKTYLGKKTIALSHSGHLMKNIALTKSRQAFGISSTKTMGDYLNEQFGSDFYLIGLISSNNHRFKNEYPTELLESQISKLSLLNYAYVPSNSSLMAENILFGGSSFAKDFPSDYKNFFDYNPKLFFNSLIYYRNSLIADIRKPVQGVCDNSSPINVSSDKISIGYGCKKFKFTQYLISNSFPQFNTIHGYKDEFDYTWSEVISLRMSHPKDKYKADVNSAKTICKLIGGHLPKIEDYFRLSQFFGADFYSKESISSDLKSFKNYKFQIFDQILDPSNLTENYELVEGPINKYFLFEPLTGSLLAFSDTFPKPQSANFRCIIHP